MPYIFWILYQYFKNKKRAIQTWKTEDQRLEQVTSGHKCSLRSSICFSHLGFCFVFGSMSVLCFSLLSFYSLAKYGRGGWTQSQSVHRAALWPTERASWASVPWTAVTSKHWLYFSSSVVVPRQLSLLYTSSPSFQGIITQPSKYQNMLRFETWGTESQLQNDCGLLPSLRKYWVLKVIYLLFSNMFAESFKLSIGKCTKKDTPF